MLGLDFGSPCHSNKCKSLGFVSKKSHSVRQAYKSSHLYIAPIVVMLSLFCVDMQLKPFRFLILNYANCVYLNINLNHCKYPFSHIFNISRFEFIFYLNDDMGIIVLHSFSIFKVQ